MSPFSFNRHVYFKSDKNTYKHVPSSCLKRTPKTKTFVSHRSSSQSDSGLLSDTSRNLFDLRSDRKRILWSVLLLWGIPQISFFFFCRATDTFWLSLDPEETKQCNVSRQGCKAWHQQRKSGSCQRMPFFWGCRPNGVFRLLVVYSSFFSLSLFIS